MLHATLGTALLAREYSSTETAAAVMIWLAIVTVLWLLPTIIAVRRRVFNVGSIAVINIFLGWTFIGWVAALAMACQTARRPPRES